MCFNHEFTAVRKCGKLIPPVRISSNKRTPNRNCLVTVQQYDGMVRIVSAIGNSPTPRPSFKNCPAESHPAYWCAFISFTVDLLCQNRSRFKNQDNFTRTRQVPCTQAHDKYCHEDPLVEVKVFAKQVGNSDNTNCTCEPSGACAETHAEALVAVSI